MYDNKKKQILAIFLFTAAVLWIIYIFYNSFQDSVVSAERSKQLLKTFDEIFANINVPKAARHNLLRKGAHVFEYTILGLILGFFLRYRVKKFHYFFPITLSVGLIVAICDEVLQTFVSGRGGKITDVLIDFGGIAIGWLLLILIIFLGQILLGVFSKRDNK